MTNTRFVLSSCTVDRTGLTETLIEHLNKKQFSEFRLVTVFDYHSWYKVIWEIPSDCEKIKQIALQMFEADEAFGCGFYQDDDWKLAYAKLQKLVGYRGETAALGDVSKFDKLPDA